METFCQYCSHQENPCSHLLKGFYCTRERGHSGACVCCGAVASDHDILGAAPDGPAVLVIPPAHIASPAHNNHEDHNGHDDHDNNNVRRCVCVRAVPAGGAFAYYSPAVLVERVTKDGRRIWRMLASRPAGRDFRSKAKAIKAAEEIAADLGIPVILGARHNRPVNADNH